MTEIVGKISGDFNAKGQYFPPGTTTLHPCMTPHGQDSKSYEAYMKSEQKPFKTDESNYVFMFESGYLLKTTKYAGNDPLEIEPNHHMETRSKFD